MNNIQVVSKYIKEKNIEIDNSGAGIKISHDYDCFIISGSQSDLIELADYITSVALSKDKNDHIHIDNTTLINEESDVKELIIEKE